MTSPARAPRPTPRRQPVVERPVRPDLRVVGPPRRGPRTGLVVVAVAAAVFAALFVAAASHSMVVTGQVHLDEVGRQVRAEQELLQKDKARLADDQSPARITREAERLGMVPATEQNWVSPGDGTATVVTGTTPTPTTVAPEADGTSSTDGTSTTDGTSSADELAAGADTGAATDR
ncbi:MAG: hypothetical protein KF703_20220 [Actinobacteria bacterium]|nr:hypothetical protein [Actinomycetota bacterium]